MSLHIFSKQTKIDFVGMRHYAYGLSALLILVGLITIFMNGGLRYGVDFAGGAAVQLQFEKPVADEDIKKSLAEMELPGLAIQQYGEDGRDYLVRFSTPNLTSEGIRSNILSSLEKSFAGNPASIQRLEMVGPKVGADLRNAALEAMYFAILLITVYISGRFEQRWMIAALMAAVLGSAMYVMEAQVELCPRRHRGAFARRPDHLGAVGDDGQRDRPEHHRGADDARGLLAQRHHHRV